MREINGTQDELLHWELYSRAFEKFFSKRFLDRKKFKAMPLRSLHIGLSRGSLTELHKIVIKIESKHGGHIDWRWLSTEGEKSPGEMPPGEIVPGVDGTNDVSVANIRSWSNRILVGMQAVDLVVSDVVTFIPGSITMALMCLQRGGSAYVRLPLIVSASVVTTIYLFAQCFESVSVAHLVAADRIYLVGNGYVGGITAGRKKKLLEFCEVCKGAPGLSLFRHTFIDKNEQFAAYVKIILGVNEAIYAWRIGFYSKILSVYRTAIGKEATEVFPNYLRALVLEEFKDESKSWMEAVEYIGHREQGRSALK